MQIIITLLVLTLIVVAHEWGHFIVARKIGVPVREFAVGFGPELFSRKKDDVQYSIRAIPLGGFVRMGGDEDDDLEDPNGYIHRKPWEKMAIAVAGPIMNFVVALVLFILIFSVLGIPYALNEPVVGGIVENSPAAAAGLQEGDRCLEVNGAPVTTWTDFTDQIARTRLGDNLFLLIERDGVQRTVEMTPQYDAAQDRMMIGIYNTVIYERVDVLKAIPMGFEQTWQMTYLLLEGLMMMLTGQVGMDDLAGPVGITTMISDAAQSGTVTFLAFMAFLSVNLGILNLLPIPALDGSKIIFAALEWIRGKKIDPEREAMVNWFGFVLLIGLMVMATFNDIGRLING